jgi:hypothetical protein
MPKQNVKSVRSRTEQELHTTKKYLQNPEKIRELILARRKSVYGEKTEDA